MTRETTCKVLERFEQFATHVHVLVNMVKVGPFSSISRVFAVPSWLDVSMTEGTTLVI